MLEKLLNLVVSGAVSGAIYSLVAAGLVLTYNATGIFNLGYGAVAFATAFVYFELTAGLGWPVVPAALVAVLVFAPLLGLVLDKLIFRALAQASESAKIMGTVGILIAVPALVRWAVQVLIGTFGADIPDGTGVFAAPGIGPSPKVNWTLPGGISFDSNQLIVFVAAAACAVGLWVLLRHTALGLRMRAAVDRPQLAELRGVSASRTSATSWVLGTTLAGLAGVVAAPIFNQLDPATYTLIMFVATAAAVLGGLRSVPLAFAGGLLLGIAQNLVAGYAGFASSIPGFGAAVPFVLLLVGLVVMGRDRSRRGGVSAHDVPPVDHRADLPPWRRAVPWVVLVVALLGYLFLVADRFWVGTVTLGLGLSLVFVSFVVVTGLGGMVNLAPAAFVTASALTVGVLVNRYEAPWLLAVAGGVVVATALGAVVAMPALRLGGLSLALATLALAFLGDRVLFSWNWLRNGQEGWPVPRPSFGPVDLADDRTLAVVLMVVIGLVVAGFVNISRSASGRAMVAVRSSEVAAETSGVVPPVVKLSLFCLSAAVAGLGGAFLATFDRHATAGAYPATLGLIWLAAVVLWGVRRPAAAVAAGLSVAVLPALLTTGIEWPAFVPSWLGWQGTTSVYVSEILFGLGAIQMARSPDGILSLVSGLRHARRQRRQAPAPPPAGAPAELGAPVPTPSSSVPAHVPVSARLIDPLPVAAATADAAAPDAVLSLRSVRAGYEGSDVLEGVDLDVTRGAITAVVGANGAGKSTLCAVIGGTLAARSGAVRFDDADVTALAPHRRARRGLVLTPESRGVFPALTVEENLSMRLRTPAERAQVYERYPALGRRRGLPAGDLSGGEQQMLALAPVLVRPPPVLVVDEATLGLAPLVVDELMALLVELRDAGTSLLVVEEKANRVLGIADHVALLELGRVTWAGPVADLDVERMADAYLGGAGAPPAGAAR